MRNLAAAGDAVEVVTVAVEPAVDQQTVLAIAAATAPLGARAGRWALGVTPAEQLRYQIDPKWHGELPRSYWYDADGKQVAVWSGLVTPSVLAKMSGISK